MSKDISIFEQQSTAVSTTRRQSALSQSLARANTITNRRIATNTNGTFKKIVNGEQVGEAIRGEFNCIIVNALANVSRIYYKEEYDPKKEPTLPNCWSNLGDKPEAAAADPQSPNCTNCPQNVKGSGKNGARACRYQRRIAIILEGDSDGDVYQFTVPAKSLFGKGSGNVHPFESYVKFLFANRQAPDTVVTRLAYDTDADTMELMFSPLREITDEEYELVVEAQGRPEAEGYTRITVAQTDGVTKLPPKQEAPKVQRSDEPDDEELEVQEPTKRASKKVEEETQESDNLVGAVFEKWAEDDDE